MGFRVTWCLVANDTRALDNDRFPATFASYEDAVAFILERIDHSPAFGYDRIREFWWLRGASAGETETRFWISRHPAGSMQQNSISGWG